MTVPPRPDWIDGLIDDVVSKVRHENADLLQRVLILVKRLGSNGVNARIGNKSVSVSGTTGIIVLLVALLGGAGWVLYQHAEATNGQHAIATRAIDELTCILTIEHYSERRDALRSGNVCAWALTGAMRGSGER
jgi:hypothetical protein